ncbi:CMGC/CK2 protein kinase [Thecamonas trahens ATCC 50062]|uniref:CMGC/CK2 protein kinase n=1 Tax=Thecamonas trahens ATCC 50062 TaxID=461836 RepID=A0A0L0D246_THETB|nr:CMGC/CK2 protein kinase [Thecamonas trahens ATCC 50062]KNC46190.1 CMGC/CK2 protein kinase [Thecamonas trahens ATCC 50062]|eukprot:XP_013763165.1 CMGC/CK2 protein kinase [Thecamonas trahens ATCC 50062]
MFRTAVFLPLAVTRIGPRLAGLTPKSAAGMSAVIWRRAMSSGAGSAGGGAARDESDNDNNGDDFARDSEGKPIFEESDYYIRYRVPKWNHDWIARETEELIAKAYKRHHALNDHSDKYPIRPSREELESIKPVNHYKPQNVTDKIAFSLVSMLRPLTHMFFRDRYLSHACVLETVAACPGMVAGAFRHMRSLRTMTPDKGWVPHLWEEAENEAAHLMTWMAVIEPTRLERFLVVAAQAVYVTAYALMYATSPRMAHRFVGYLEEEAISAYTLLLESIDSGAQADGPAPDFAKKYWNLPDDATLRDVVLYVRADEAQHALFNHRLSEIIATTGVDSELDVPGEYPSTVDLPPDHPDRVAMRSSITTPRPHPTSEGN